MLGSIRTTDRSEPQMGVRGREPSKKEVSRKQKSTARKETPMLPKDSGRADSLTWSWGRQTYRHDQLKETHDPLSVERGRQLAQSRARKNFYLGGGWEGETTVHRIATDSKDQRRLWRRGKTWGHIMYPKERRAMSKAL